MKAEKLLKTVSDEKVRAFLRDILQKDEHYATLFINTFGPLDLAAAIESLDDEINRAMWQRADRHGFIHYRSAREFGWDWTKALGTAVDPLLERGEWEAIIILVLQALKSVWEVQMDDSDGIVENMLFAMRDYFEQVLDRAGETFETRFIEIVCDFLCNPPTRTIEREMFGYQADEAEEFLFKRFGSDARHTGQIAQFAQTRIDQEKAKYDRILVKEGKNSWNLKRAERSVGTWLMRLLHARKLEGATVSELVEIAGDDATIENVCIMLQAEARAQRDTQLARELLERTKLRYLAEGSPYPLRVSEQLAKLLDEDEVEALREELLYQMNFQETGFQARSHVPALWPRLRATYEEGEWVFVRDAWIKQLTGTWAQLETLECDGRYDELMDEAEQRGIDGLRHFEATLSKFYPERMLRAYLVSRISSPATIDSLWKQVKAACPEDMWPDLARKLISLMPDADKRMERFAKEEMFDDLMDEVEKAGITALSAWRKELSEHCPDRVTAMVADDLLNDNCLKPASRKAYTEFCNRVLALKKLPGGDEAAERVVAETKRRYPTRKALHEELRRVGL